MTTSKVGYLPRKKKIILTHECDFLQHAIHLQSFGRDSSELFNISLWKKLSNFLEYLIYIIQTS